jgi:hypothetical protein
MGIDEQSDPRGAWCAMEMHIELYSVMPKFYSRISGVFFLDTNFAIT